MSLPRLIVASVMAASATNSPASAKSEPVVTIETGKLVGDSEAGVDSWKGIPFVAAPIGKLRWRKPQPAAKWRGTRSATAYAHDCMQFPFPSDAAPLGTPPGEDCLYANVWKPSTATTKLPVILWIYGGGFVNGGASSSTYSGAQLAKQGAVFISFNYRVGRFGTFAHPLLSKVDADHGALGNYGFMDQIAALHWVQRNAAQFGGDPANVTLIGESAGGMSVHTLLTSPQAKGLFAKAVIMSGGDGNLLGSGGLKEAEVVGTEFARSQGIEANDPRGLEELRALSAQAVTGKLNMAALFANGPRTFSSPFVDGVIAVDTNAAYQSGNFGKVPVMIGATSADMAGKTGYMIAGARREAARIAAQGVPVYAYRFSYVAESLDKAGAGHATDVPFFLDTQAAKYGAHTTQTDNVMGQTISAYVMNFARSGNPNGDGLPQWSQYDPSKDQIIDFSRTGHAVLQKDPWGAEIDAAQPTATKH
ncbi:carboxylesterase/lipase family protein [Sphingomonas sp. NFX23]|uniref:carboxylesterase/lipase family protein n=1 Tax=Sphingomonas sp. NFX23 TaxID=2819532 RepID=UPI003CED7863